MHLIFSKFVLRMQAVITVSKATAFPLIEHELEASLDHFQMIILAIPAKLTKTIMNPKNSRHARMTKDLKLNNGDPLSNDWGAPLNLTCRETSYHSILEGFPTVHVFPILHSENRGIQGYAATQGRYATAPRLRRGHCLRPLSRSARSCDATTTGTASSPGFSPPSPAMASRSSQRPAGWP